MSCAPVKALDSRKCYLWGRGDSSRKVKCDADCNDILFLWLFLPKLCTAFSSSQNEERSHQPQASVKQDSPRRSWTEALADVTLPPASCFSFSCVFGTPICKKIVFPELGVLVASLWIQGTGRGVVGLPCCPAPSTLNFVTGGP